MVRENFDPGISVDREFSRKVARLVQTHTVSSEIGTPGKSMKLMIKFLGISRNNRSPISRKYSTSSRVFRKESRRTEDSPYLLSIGEKADAVIQLYKDRQKSTKDTLAELKQIVEEINAALEQQKRNIPADEFSIFWILNKTGINDPDKFAHDMRGILFLSPLEDQRTTGPGCQTEILHGIAAFGKPISSRSERSLIR